MGFFALPALKVKMSEENSTAGRKKHAGGRPPGRQNNKTLARLATIAAAKSPDPEEFLTAIMTSDSPLVTLRDRIDCAKALLTAKRFAKEVKPDPKLVEAQPKPQWELDRERREYLLAQQRIGKVRPGGALDRELRELLELERERVSIGF
jgi:hypothetical protein